MWVTTVLHRPVVPVPLFFTSRLSPKVLLKPKTFRFGFPLPSLKLKASATKKQLQTQEPDNEDLHNQEKSDDQSFDLGWLPTFPHILVASMSNFLFGYHIGVMNGPIVSIARELGFEGDPILEGLVVSIFIAGAFIGSLSCGSLVDKLGCRRTFQIDTIPLILGAIVSAQAHSLNEILLGRFLVGLGIGVNTVLVPIYISEVAPTKYRGSLGTLSQIGTCLGIIFSLCLGIPAEHDPHW
ncbi:putative plastidic glucose transporter 1 [Gossypium australe]|uniref:Putative plastidic glucose transporter 1 n=1 Tax=Gossypium australe TaxID=47621 RepID=A0A5B6UYJ7_9ROSI|nr:putative plastidic glucose transporter 1 [Gossypium australe]